MPFSTSIKVEILDWLGAREAAMRIRTLVFVEEQGVPAAMELDEHDPDCEHALAYAVESGEIIGTGRLLPNGHIGRMAVLTGHRGNGVGAALLSALIERARQRGFATAVLNAQTQALGFYRRFGFIETGEPFDEAGIPHITMRRALDSVPATA